VVTPYAGLSNVGALSRLTDQYGKPADDDDWSDTLGAYLSRQVRLRADQGSPRQPPLQAATRRMETENERSRRGACRS
jgi:hypothetical protein